MKNDSHLFPVETPMDSLFDSNKDGELTGFETTMRDAALYDSEKCFHESKADYDPSPELNFSTSHNNNSNSKLQSGYNILFVLVISFIAIACPIITIAGLIIDADYFFEQGEFIFAFIVSMVELIILLVVLCQKINRSCKPDLSNCKNSEECSIAIEKAEKEKQKKYTKIALIVISICIAIGLIAFLGFDLSYRAAINEAIESEHAWSFHFDVDKHPNYKDAQGWELYCKAKMYSVKEYKEDFLKYEFKHTNAKQDKAIQELKNKINGVNNTNENNYYDTDNLHELVGIWYCPAYQSCNGGSITITIKQKGNTLYFNRDMIMSTSAASSNIDYEVSLPVNDSFRVDDIHCTYVFDGSTLKEEFDNDRENLFERVFEDSSTSDTTTANYNGATEYSHYTTTKHYTTKHYTTKHRTTKRYTENDDPYNAKDYGNEEDFYEDHYDDFFDYYDAEDYYMEHHDD